MSQEFPFFLPLQTPPHSAATQPLSTEDWLQAAGGKGSNLVKLARADFPVPDGFILTTRAYQEYVAANRLAERIQAALPASPDDPAGLQAASATIFARFENGDIPAELANALRQAYRAMGSPPVAVRSSATAEDLPEMSFAGQQNTYLNVIGEPALLQAVVRCWASLWTARAIGYRARNQVAHHSTALAVVVQRMAPAEVSGVLFTANPLSGLRRQTVIDATYGLGEALVSGQVQPDHYEVDTTRRVITTRTLGSKALAIQPLPGGGTRRETPQGSHRQALPDDAILALSDLGQQVAALYGQPQDIEWAWANGQFYLLQSRAVTSLFPIPAGTPAGPLEVFFSFGAVQGMLDPITPLGRDAMRHLIARGARLLDIHVTAHNQTVLYEAGERLWIRLTSLIRNSVGRKVLTSTLGFVEPSTRPLIAALLDEPALQPGRQGLSLRARWQLAHLAVPLAGNVLLNIVFPQARRTMILARTERLLIGVAGGLANLDGPPRERLRLWCDHFQNLIAKHLLPNLILLASTVAAGMASLNLLRLRMKNSTAPDAGWSDAVLEVTRGVPHNPTTAMDLALWAAANAIRQHPAAQAEFNAHTAAELAAAWQAGGLHPVTRQVLDSFMQRYGGRGLAEIDLGRPRWAEEPAHIFEMLAGFLLIPPGDQSPDAVFARSAASGEAAVQRIAAALRQARGGWFKAPLARFLGCRARALLGMREAPKFFAVRLFAQYRWALLAAGQELVAAGELSQPDDLFYLTFAEIRAFAAAQSAPGRQDWHALIAGRREANCRETLRRQVPRLLLSDGRAFYDGMSAESRPGGLSGSPVSPGVVEANVRIVIDPRQAGLLPGEIMVCPGSDPSWTPLFLTAAGLIMEVGGMMTHGAVVAREYGIPAVVGVDRATQRLHTGQRIRLNGSTGAIEVIEAD